MNKNIYIALVLLLTLAFSTKAIANLTVGSTSLTSNAALTLSTGSSTLTLPTTNGSNGQVLTTNGSGVTSWTTVSGGGGLTCTSCTTNTIPIFDGANLVDSKIADDGNILTVQTELAQIYLPSLTVGQPATFGVGMGDALTSGVFVLDANTVGLGTPYEGNHTQVRVNDLTQTITAQTADIFRAGDLDSGNSELLINATINQVTLGQGGGDNAFGFESVRTGSVRVATLGDGQTLNNGTFIRLDDMAQLATIQTNLGLRIVTAGLKPICDSVHRGTWFTTEGGAGVADKTEQCMKRANDAYAWVAVVTAP